MLPNLGGALAATDTKLSKFRNMQPSEYAFISYSSSDREFVLKLEKELSAAGINTWLDKNDIEPGNHWDASIQDALEHSSRMIFVLSRASIASRVVNNEFSFALTNKVVVIPVLSEKFSLPHRFGIMEYIDLTDDYEAGFRKLLDECKKSRGDNRFVGIIEHTPDLPSESNYSYRSLAIEELGTLYELARKTYGVSYTFSENDLKGWWRCNPNCYYGLFCDRELVGYFDAFPISDEAFNDLTADNEKTLSPLNADQLTNECSFYIASFVVLPQHSSQIQTFINKAFEFYSTAYPVAKWDKICALAYTPAGEKWCRHKGMNQVNEGDMWSIDKASLTFLTRENKLFWQPLLSLP